MKSTDPRHSVAWQKLRKRIVAAARAADLPCAECGKPIAYDIGGRHPLGPSVDHIEALALNPYQPIDSSFVRVLHTTCNARLGGRLGRARQLGRAPRRRQAITARRW